MKRFLKVILIMAVVFGVLGLGLTAGDNVRCRCPG